MDLPPEQPVPMAHVQMCVNQAVRAYPELKPWMIKTVIATEGGRIGTVRKNTDDSEDLGVMQINTINLPLVTQKLGYSYRDLVVSPCKNIMAGSMLLYQRFIEAGKKPWHAIGNYHSKTPHLRRAYLKKAVEAYIRLVDGAKRNRQSAAMGRTTNYGRVDGQSNIPSLRAIEQYLEPGAAGANAGKDSRVIAIDNKNSNLRFIEP